MKWLRKKCKGKVATFLFFNILFYAGIGALIWTGVSVFALKSVEWLIIFSGYAAVIFGYLGGIFSIWKEE